MTKFRLFSAVLVTSIFMVQLITSIVLITGINPYEGLFSGLFISPDSSTNSDELKLKTFEGRIFWQF